MQLLQHPRHVTEHEDVHLIRSFLISTKPNKALWTISKETGHKKAKEWIGKDFYIAPERIFKPLDEGVGGHIKGRNYQEELAMIQKRSSGKIEKIYGPFYYDDSPEDYWYECGIKLNGSKTASILLDVGEKTWTHFAVSPHVWPREGDDDNMTDYDPMGLALVIEGAYGDEAVIKKMCTGSALKCGTSLTAAISELSSNTSNEYLNEVLSSYLSKAVQYNTMSTQEVTGTSTNTVPNLTSTTISTAPIQQPQVELKQDEKITFTKEEYDAIVKERESAKKLSDEVAELKQERNTTILTSVFGSIEDETTRNQVFERYNDKDVKLVKQVAEDMKVHILPQLVEAKLAESKNAKESEKKESKTASLKREPRISDSESKTASVNEEPTAQELRSLIL